MICSALMIPLCDTKGMNAALRPRDSRVTTPPSAGWVGRETTTIRPRSSKWLHRFEPGCIVVVAPDHQDRADLGQAEQGPVHDGLVLRRRG